MNCSVGGYSDLWVTVLGHGRITAHIIERNLGQPVPDIFTLSEEFITGVLLRFAYVALNIEQGFLRDINSEVFFKN